VSHGVEACKPLIDLRPVFRLRLATLNTNGLRRVFQQPVRHLVALPLVAAGLAAALRAVAVALPDAARPGLVAGLRSFLADPGSPHAVVLNRLSLSTEGGLDVDAVVAHVGSIEDQAVAGLESSGDRAALLYRALRELIFFALFLLGDRLSPAEDEALSRATRERLAQAGAHV